MYLNLLVSDVLGAAVPWWLNCQKEQRFKVKDEMLQLQEPNA